MHLAATIEGRAKAGPNLGNYAEMHFMEIIHMSKVSLKPPIRGKRGGSSSGNVSKSLKVLMVLLLI